MKKIPVVPLSALQDCCILTEDDCLRYGEVLYRAERLAECLPDSRHSILLCERTDLFIIGFLALLMRRQTLLLPSSRTVGSVQDILADFPDASCLVDDGALPLDLPGLNCSLLDGQQGESRVVPELPADHLAAIVFTSGTTGRSQPNPKYWGDLVAGSALLRQRLKLHRSSVIVATVPPQHMYGLETSVLAPLLSGAGTYGTRLFYPADIKQALATAGAHSVLVTTPLHLRACAGTDLEWPQVPQVVSATAPLDKSLAVQVERVMNTQLQEIFGCSEAGSFASRHTSSDDEWQMYEGMRIAQSGVTAEISGGHLPQTVSLTDHVQVLNSVSFRFMGRLSDMVKIAGKRASLAELNYKLNRIPGVEDGVFVMREEQQSRVPRLLALVVAPALNPEQIQSLLTASVDAVFLPRPLLMVERLPRNEANKLPRLALDELLNDLGY